MHTSDCCQIDMVCLSRLGVNQRTRCLRSLHSGSITSFTVPRASTDLAAKLAAAEVCCVHVGIGQTVTHDSQGGVKITYGNALADGSRDICRRNRSGDSSGRGRWTIWLVPATA